jgi:hypothetical protein
MLQFVAEKTPGMLSKRRQELIIRILIADLENWGRSLEPIECPLKHIFPPGLYVREIFIPKGMLVIGKIHRHEHLNFMSRGKVTVLTKDGLETIEGPRTMISSAGTKRALYTHEDTVWTTVHLNPTNTQDLKQLESEIIAVSYAEFDQLENIIEG